METEYARAAAPEATAGFAESDGPQAADIRFTRVTLHGWRLCDARLPAGDPLRLLAFIERRGEEFEVLQLGAGFEWHGFTCFESAVDHVRATATAMARKRMAGDLAWIGKADR